ncbi:MAG: hypothetical protein EXS16_05325 [Gemmataceae bacterium]|nr:hypothetical protein [Gemmataceae bacterium]
MSKDRQNRRKMMARQTCRSLVIGSIALTFAVFTGCSTSHNSSTQAGHDPLKGILAPPAAMPIPNQQQAMTGTLVSPPQGGVPAIPTAFSGTNNAGLAAMSTQGPLGRPLAIDDDGKSRPTADWARQGQALQTPTMPGYPGASTTPRVERLRDNSATPPFTPIIGWQSQGSPLSTAQTANTSPTNLPLDTQLKERGVHKQSVAQVPEGILLTCYLSRGPAGGIRILEATASDYLSAAQVILERLNQDSEKKGQDAN